MTDKFCMEMLRRQLQYVQLKNGTPVFQKKFQFCKKSFKGKVMKMLKSPVTQKTLEFDSMEL